MTIGDLLVWVLKLPAWYLAAGYVCYLIFWFVIGGCKGLWEAFNGRFY